jgi:hypothetical protein
MKNLDDAIDRAENGNPTLRQFIHFRSHEDNPNIGLSDQDQKLLDKLKLLDFIENEKSKSPTPPPNPSASSMNYKKTTVEIPAVDIDRSQYQDFSERTQPGPSTTSNKPNICSHTKNFDKFNFGSLSCINSSASEIDYFDQDSVVSDHFHTSSGKIEQPPRESWKVDPSNNIQIKGFKKLSEVDPSGVEPKSDDEIRLCSKLDEMGVVIDMGEDEELKGYWEVVNGPNGQLRKEVVVWELDS